MAYDSKRLVSDDEHGTVVRYFREWEEALVNHNIAAMRDRDYYDGHQWNPTDLQILKDRKQPPTVINRIQPKVDYVSGIISDRKEDPRAYPRTPYHEEDANAITDMLRFLDDKNNFKKLSNQVANEVLVEGISGEVFGVTPKLGPDGRTIVYDITETKVPWHQFWYDPHSREPDFSDAMYMGTAVWWDYDEACNDPRYRDNEEALNSTMYGHAGLTDDATDDRPHDWFDHNRNRILILECYYRQFDKKTKQIEWFGCHFTGGGFLIKPFKVPFLDENGRTWCPIWMVSGHVAGRYNYRYGMVRNLIPVQDEINKRRSKLLHLLNSRQIAAEDGAFLDPQNAQTELAKPDGFVKLTRGALKDQRFQVLETQDLAQGQMQLLQESKMEIDTIGPHAALISSQSNELSGRAFLAQQEAGVMEIKPIFDNLHEWKVGSYRRKWWLTKQYTTEELWFRIEDDTTGFRFAVINQKTNKLQRLVMCLEREWDLQESMLYIYGPQDGMNLMNGAQQYVQQQQAVLQQQMQRVMQAGQQAEMMMQQGVSMPAVVMADIQNAAAQTQQAMQSFNPQQVMLQFLAQQPQSQEPFDGNNVAKLDFDIILETSPHSVVLEHEQYQELSLMAQKGMFGQPIPVDIIEMIIQASSLPDKKKLINILKKPPPPEVVQQQQQMQQMNMELLAAEVAEMKANMALLQAKAAESQAKVSKVPAETRHEESSAILNIAKAQAVPVETRIKMEQAKAAAMSEGAKSVPQEKKEDKKPSSKKKVK